MERIHGRTLSQTMDMDTGEGERDTYVLYLHQVMISVDYPVEG